MRGPECTRKELFLDDKRVAFLFTEDRLTHAPVHSIPYFPVVLAHLRSAASMAMITTMKHSIIDLSDVCGRTRRRATQAATRVYKA